MAAPMQISLEEIISMLLQRVESLSASDENSKTKQNIINRVLYKKGILTDEDILDSVKEDYRMLKELGVAYVIIGHSERRQYFGESDQTVNARAKAALSAGLRVILCVGETLEQRESGEMEAVIRRQMAGALEGITGEQLREMVIAYEPVWAIGTGRTATAAQAGEVCGLIRSFLAEHYGAEAADGMRIQYGGSMNAGNAAELLAQPDIDGGLIGGASLKPVDFSKIIAATAQGACE